MKAIKSIILSVVIAGAAVPAFAQTPQRIPTPNDTITPVRKLPNGNVLFSVYAPKAREIVLKGDVANYNNEITTRQSSNGVWTFEVTNVPEGALRYYYIIDGVATKEPTSVKPEIQTTVASLDNGDEFFAYKKDVPHGTVSIHWYESKNLGTTRRVHVWTPAGYEKSKGKTKLPVLYLLHGGGDNDEAWYKTGQANNILDNLLAEGKMEPMIVVMPDGGCGIEPFTVDVRESLIPYIQNTYNVYTDSAHRAIAGLSMGGMEVLDILEWDYQMYKYVWVLSSGWMFNEKMKDPKNEQHMKEIIPDINKNVKELVFTQGGKEDITYYNGDLTMNLFKKLGMEFEYIEAPGGGHTWYTWRNDLYHLAQRIFK